MWPYLPVLLLLSLGACNSKSAIKEGVCSEDDDDLYTVCIDAGCSATRTNSATGIDTCDVDAEGGLTSASGSAECRLEGSGTCQIVCDCSGLDDDEDEAATDADGDGVIAPDDCDDEDPLSTVVADDADCDGARTDDDCDDSDSTLGAQSEDGDCDGLTLDEDCDDSDPAATAIADDGDCDGVLRDADCDDFDPESTTIAMDADCDGIPTTQDCDDRDVDVGAVGSLAAPEVVAGLSMVSVCGHEGDIGCTEGQAGCGADEEPILRVEVTSDFQIGVSEVTQAEYSEYFSVPSGLCGRECPVVSVSWHMAAAYANAVSDAAGLDRCYDCSGTGSSTYCIPRDAPHQCDGFRLPTEAEWELAARCGSDTLYAGGESVSEVAWYDGNSGSTLHPSRELAANGCGLYDMSGNASEWVHDWYDSATYSEGTETDPAGPSTGSSKVVRGGFWLSSAGDVRLAKRASALPELQNNYVGFRLARTLTE